MTFFHAPDALSTVTRADAPKVLEYNWGGADVRWELEAFGGGTRLTLWHNIGRRFISWGGGWPTQARFWLEWGSSTAG